jgi:hypothetical protein
MCGHLLFIRVGRLLCKFCTFQEIDANPIFLLIMLMKRFLKNLFEIKIIFLKFINNIKNKLTY